jgi:putative restriction endonuclease
MANEKWTREQTIVALHLYFQIPFNRARSNHPDVIRIAKIIGRNANAVKMKIGNFGKFDAELRKRGIFGLGNTSKLDELIWNEYHSDWQKLVFESEILIAQFKNQTIEESLDFNFPAGLEREANIKQRVNQSFFRSNILASYNIKCCITGLSIPDFLVASHIIPWSKDEFNRLNPQNGLCLNSIHDKAFDKGFITITNDYHVKVSPQLKNYKNESAVLDFFVKYDKQKITLPDRFDPSKEFLDYHFENIFKK